MGYYSLLWITDDLSKMEETLNIYSKKDYPKENRVFIDEEEKYREMYSSNAEWCRTKEGQLHLLSYGKYKYANSLSKEQEKEGEIVTLPFSAKYETFDSFIKDYAGIEKDEETGKYGYWKNPLGSFQHYVIGGEFNGFFLIKEGVDHYRGKLSIFTRRKEETMKPPTGYIWTDCCQIKDIEWDLMKKEYEKEAERVWNEEEEFFGKELYSKRAKTTKEEFIKNYFQVSTYAVITPNGKWNCLSDAGKWNLDKETFKAKEEWSKTFFDRFIKSANPESYIMLLECKD